MPQCCQYQHIDNDATHCIARVVDAIQLCLTVKNAWHIYEYVATVLFIYMWRVQLDMCVVW